MKLSDSPAETASLNSAAVNSIVDSTAEDYDIEAHPVNEEQPRRSRCKPTEESRNMWYLNVFLFLLLLVGFGYILISLSVTSEPRPVTALTSMKHAGEYISLPRLLLTLKETV